MLQGHQSRRSLYQPQRLVTLSSVTATMFVTTKRLGTLSSSSSPHLELIRGEGNCTSKTDWHSLAVLLFYMFVRHHPLEGKRQLKINVFNEVAQREFYGNKPVFLFDATDKSNEATKGFHDSAIRYWNLYLIPQTFVPPSLRSWTAQSR